MKNVIFFSPHFGVNTLRFVKELRLMPYIYLIGLGQDSEEYIHSFGNYFDDFFHIEDPMNVDELIEVVGEINSIRPVHCILNVLESMQVQISHVRQHYNLPGIQPEIARRVRDKAYMKQVLKKCGVKCANFQKVTTIKDAVGFIEDNGFPVIIKPIGGENCRFTYTIDNWEHFDMIIDDLPISPFSPAIIEEFITGDEGSFDTLTLYGKVRFCSTVMYNPNPLTAVENPWIQSIYFFSKDWQETSFAESLKELGVNVINAIGIETSMTHMEWFLRERDKKFYVGEIAARPPGEPIFALHNYGHDINLFREWGNLMVNGRFDIKPTPRWHVGCAGLRAQGRGFIQEINGIEEVHEKVGHLIIDETIPEIGTPKKTFGYLGEGKIFCRGTDFDEVYNALNYVIETVQIKAYED